MNDSHEVRELRYKVRALSKQNGRQGETIHRLRAELAEVRELHSKIERSELRRLERFELNAQEKLALFYEEIQRLREKLAGK